MRSLYRYAVLFLIVAFIITFPVTSLAEQPEGGFGGVEKSLTQESASIKIWETPIFNEQIVVIDLSDNPNTSKPRWVITKKEVSIPSALFDFTLIHLGPIGQIQRSVNLGAGFDIKASADGHTFALMAPKFDDPKSPEYMDNCVQIIDNAGHIKHEIQKSLNVVHLGPGGSHMIALGGTEGLIEVYDSQMRLTEAYGNPIPENDEHIYNKVVKAGKNVLAIAINGYESGTSLYVLNDKGGLLFSKPDISSAMLGGKSIEIDDRNKLILFTANKYHDGKKKRYFNLMDFKGEELWRKVYGPKLGSGQRFAIQFSENAQYIRISSPHYSSLVDRKGTLKYSVKTSVGSNDYGHGVVKNNGQYVGTLANSGHWLSVDPNGDVKITERKRPPGRILKISKFEESVLVKEMNSKGNSNLIVYRLPNEIVELVSGK